MTEFIHQNDYPKNILISALDFQCLIDKMHPGSRKLQEDGSIIVDSGYPYFFETKINVFGDELHELKIKRDEAEKKRPLLLRWKP